MWKSDVLPDRLLKLLYRHILHPHSATQDFGRRAAMTAERGLGGLFHTLEPAMDRLTRALYNSPDIVVLAFVVVLVVVMFQVLVWLKRIVVWWTRLAFRVALWACIVGLIAVVWQRGLQASLRDAVAIASALLGYAAVVKDIWVREYRRYDAQTRAGSRAGVSGAARAGYRIR